MIQAVAMTNNVTLENKPTVEILVVYVLGVYRCSTINPVLTEK